MTPWSSRSIISPSVRLCGGTIIPTPLPFLFSHPFRDKDGIRLWRLHPRRFMGQSRPLIGLLWRPSGSMRWSRWRQYVSLDYSPFNWQVVQLLLLQSIVVERLQTDQRMTTWHAHLSSSPPTAGFRRTSSSRQPQKFLWQLFCCGTCQEDQREERRFICNRQLQLLENWCELTKWVWLHSHTCHPAEVQSPHRLKTQVENPLMKQS